MQAMLLLMTFHLSDPEASEEPRHYSRGVSEIHEITISGVAFLNVIFNLFAGCIFTGCEV